MLVQQILKSKGNDDVVTVRPGSTVQSVAELLSSRRIGAVIVSPSDSSTPPTRPSATMIRMAWGVNPRMFFWVFFARIVIKCWMISVISSSSSRNF